MQEEKKESPLGLLLKSLMKERSLSMRKLSEMTRIDTATISRIINGKQAVRPQHLQQFASYLGVPTERLFEVAGFINKREPKDQHVDISTSVDTIQEAFFSSHLFNHQHTVSSVEQELAKYEQYAQTEEGQRKILEEFHEKVQQVGGVGPFIDHLKEMYTLFSQGNVTPAERFVLGSALLYFILSTDIIPDYLFPIGYLDDAIAVQLVLNRLLKMKQNESND